MSRRFLPNAGRTTLRIRLTAAALLSAAVAPAAAQEIAPHRAEYGVEMLSAPGGQSMTVAGKMVLEVRDACDGRRLRNETRLRMVVGGGRPIVSTVLQRFWESRDSTRYRFSMISRVGNRTVQAVKGSARLDGDGKAGVARIEHPTAKTIDLPPGTLFPFAFARRYSELWNSRGERKSYLYFDGISQSDGTMRVIARALKKHGLPAGHPSGDLKLLAEPPRPYEFLYFAGSGADAGPSLSGVFLLHANGVTRSFTTETGGIKLQFGIERITALPPAKC